MTQEFGSGDEFSNKNPGRRGDEAVAEAAAAGQLSGDATDAVTSIANVEVGSEAARADDPEVGESSDARDPAEVLAIGQSIIGGMHDDRREADADGAEGTDNER